MRTGTPCHEKKRKRWHRKGSQRAHSGLESGTFVAITCRVVQIRMCLMPDAICRLNPWPRQRPFRTADPVPFSRSEAGCREGCIPVRGARFDRVGFDLLARAVPPASLHLPVESRERQNLKWRACEGKPLSGNLAHRTLWRVVFRMIWIHPSIPPW
jgi:hypothetical protein